MGRFKERQEEIRHTMEWHRINNLPRRTLTDAQLEDIRVSLTRALRRTGGKMELKTAQAHALHDIGLYGGLTGIIRVGGGKCLGRGTPVLMFDGTIKAVEDVAVGDLLMGPDSQPRRVESTCRGQENMYRVVPVKGEPYVVNESHILSLRKTREGTKYAAQGERTFDMQVTEYLELSAHAKSNIKGYRVGVDFEANEAAIEPYMIGMWLGDGSTNTPAITTADPETAQEIFSFAARCNNNVRVSAREDNASSTYHLYDPRGRGGYNTFTDLLRLYNLLGNKHVPHAFKANSREVRLEVLAGLLDSDGHLHRGGFDFVSKLEGLADDVCFLARSLGLAAYKKPCRKECVNNGVWGDYFRVSISGDCSIIPTRLPRKKAPVRKQKKSVLVTGIRLELIGPGEYFGFELSGNDRRFLLGDFTVTHNTLVSLLAPAMLHPEPRRPLLITKAALITQTKDTYSRMLEHWLVPTGIHITSYEKLGRVSGSDFLDTSCQPDMLILDEAHLSKNRKAGVTRRLVRYLHANPDTRVVVLSGTLFKASLKDAAHLIRWALKGNAPVPSHENEVEQWANALDAASRVNVLERCQPGALLEFATKEDWIPRTPEEVVTPLIAARRGFQRRMIETPGVVATQGDQVACSLNIVGKRFDPNAATERNFAHLRETWCTPDDWQLYQAIEVWACARQLALGFHLVWSPRPPDEWRAARKVWFQFVREVLKNSRKYDTPYQIELACREGALDRAAFDDWDRVRPTFTPRSKALWHDDTALRLCEEYAKKNDGIIWTEHSLFARELSRRTGLPYFGREGLDAEGNDLNVLARKVLEGSEKPRPIICSIKANATGRNLQGWSENLITSIPTEASLWEQLLGRTHRDGQRADEVNVQTLFGCFEHLDGWLKAVELAEATQDTEGSSQKLCMSTCIVPPVAYLTGPRWTKTADERAVTAAVTSPEDDELE